MKTSVVRIDSYEAKNPKGALANPFFEGERCFENLTQLILMMEEMQDALNYPQKAMESRRFKPVEASGLPLETLPVELVKPLATFKIRILFRQNASWQGSIFWLENKQESQFRSVLEMVLLIDSALSPPFQQV